MVLGINVERASVVDRVDGTIHWITSQVLIAVIQWIVIYPLHSTIKAGNNWGHKCMTQVSIRNGMRPTGFCYHLFVELTVCVKCKLLLL